MRADFRSQRVLSLFSGLAPPHLLGRGATKEGESLWKIRHVVVVITLVVTPPTSLGGGGVTTSVITTTHFLVWLKNFSLF